MNSRECHLKVVFWSPGKMNSAAIARALMVLFRGVFLS